jgi:hypothetical protein
MEEEFISKKDTSYDIRREYPKAKTRGYLYVMYSKDFPEFVKIGKTVNPSQRYNEYNNYNPRCSFTYLHISKIYEDYDYAESSLLKVLKDEEIYPKYQKEWFDSKFTEHIMFLLDSIPKY